MYDKKNTYIFGYFVQEFIYINNNLHSEITEVKYKKSYMYYKLNSKKQKSKRFNFSFFKIQREYFILFHFIFISRSFYLIEVIRASQQFNCLQGKDATPPTLFIYLTSFKDTFVIQQNLKSVTTTTRCHSYCFLCHPRILFFLRVFTISQN